MTTAAVDERVTFTATPVQERLWQAVKTPGVRLIGFGGGIRGGKSWATLVALLWLCRIYPGSRWIVVRKDLERLKKSTIPSFLKLKDRFGRFVTAFVDYVARCENGSLILFTGENIDTDPALSRFHGFEANGFLLDDGDELAERTFVKCIERAGSWIVPEGAQPPPYVFATFNPCPNWPRRRFYLPWRSGTLTPPYAFIPSTQADNPYVSDAQREAWKAMPEQEHRRFVEGDWESLAGAYYDTLDPMTHLIERNRLPGVWPPHWHYWASFDWGYAHWAVMGVWATDGDGTHYLLDSCWKRRLQDRELAMAYREAFALLPGKCLGEVYAGHDCWDRVRAHEAPGESTADIFAEYGLYLLRANVDKVNAGRAVNRTLKITNQRAGVYFVRTPSNLRVVDQLGEILPDPNDVRKRLKVDADEHGQGGDDGADMVAHGLGTLVKDGDLAPTPRPDPDRSPGYDFHNRREIPHEDPEQIVQSWFRAAAPNPTINRAHVPSNRGRTRP